MTPQAYMSRFAGLIAVLAVCAPLSAAAAGISRPEPGDAVPGAAGMIWLDLVRQVLPDYDGIRGTASIPLRHVGGAAMDQEAPAAFTRAVLSAVEAQQGGALRHLLLIDLSSSVESAEGYAALAMFDAGAAPKLVDAALVSFDRLVHFAETPTVRVAPGSDLVIVGSVHFNSSQGYGLHAMILPRDGRLELVDTVSTLGENGCGYSWTQTPAFRAGEAADRRYADIVATVTETIAHVDDECGDRTRPPELQREITVTWRWDEGVSRFIPDSDAFELLARDNEQRF